ncbi:M10 family metallopeptidase C-terminal domain-containing protein [Phenylobacterium sp.]|uniref:M10 family metallopeptidase C-terminal domain-containing protein n=1 Tax=Phenylobacterium sp. TaxID=1871053 RepID=UPI002CFA5532|nr:M10 family metallopeptidase C-terminal domain-containing protein [Phenylobacterium sp.]HVI33093.1 M10 family metallopeptidase C-terminal domain-containing protein [Phenylobacterium sp.]
MREYYLDDGFGPQGSLYDFSTPLTASAAADFGAQTNCGCPSCLRTAFYRDASGEPLGQAPAKPSFAALTAANLVTDEVGGDRATAGSLTVNGPHVISTINAPGDFDFFKVSLKAGQTYDFSVIAKTLGPSGVPLADAFVELYDSTGKLVGLSDGGASTTLNQLNSGFDAVLTFTATADGTYYVNARAFDQDATNGTGGDFVGDYEVFVAQADPRTAYKPLYTLDSPLHSIDWGSQVDRTSRNPDGDNGPRDNGSTFTGVLSNPTYGVEGKNVITYYFARQGDLFVDSNPLTPGSTDTMLQVKDMADWEKAAFRAAFAEYEKVADVVYIEVQNRAEADFKLITYQGTPGVGASLLGRMSPPNEENEGQAEFNAGDARWTQAGLQQGGFYFPTLLHEFGHGHGLSHPHDTGGRSSVMRGSDDGSVIGGGTAAFGLSQQVFTIMSYNDGWTLSPYGQPKSGGVTGTDVEHFGWMGTLAPLDIAVLQDKYGVNEEYATGADAYVLKDVNGPGTFYSAIWDAGGVDSITYAGARDARIDLRAATLQYEEGGGGHVSYAHGIHGGFVIANGVTIENATSGDGNDTLNGNAATNVLNAGGGADMLSGFGGDDLITGGAGDDTLTGGAGVDQFWFDHLSGDDMVMDFEQGVDRVGLGGNAPDSFAALTITAEARGGADGALVTWGDGSQSIWLKGVGATSLSSSDFLFA